MAPQKNSSLVIGSTNRTDAISPTDAQGRTSFVIKKISKYGTKHPVIARLKVQTHELLQWADLLEAQRNEAAKIYFDVADRLMKCHEICGRLEEAANAALQELHPTSDSRIMTVPHLIGLQPESETFLYESKNFLRDLLGVLRVFFQKAFSEASAFYKAKGTGNGDLAKWAGSRFGAGDPFTTMLISEQGWIEELIRKRNAIEHPGGRSGTLYIENFRLLADGKMIAPSWRRDDNPPTSVLHDLESYLDNMLTLAEDMLALSIHHKTRHKIIQFVEIPENDRSPECPMRITVTLDKTKLKQPI